MSRSDQINAWADRVFGKMTNPLSSIARALKEFKELEEAIKNGKDPGEISEEAADVAINLHRLVGSYGLDLDHAIDTKMMLNHARKWEKDGHGHGQHIKSEDEKKGYRESIYAVGVERGSHSVGMLYGPATSFSEVSDFHPEMKELGLQEGDRVVLLKMLRGQTNWIPMYYFNPVDGWVPCSG